jgi:hypothetical protein
MPRARKLGDLSYATYGPALEAMDGLRRKVTALAEALDDIEGAIVSDRPTPEQMARALRAWEQLPGRAMEFEAAVAPARVTTLLRRLARIRGVKAGEFARLSGRARLG